MQKHSFWPVMAKICAVLAVLCLLWPPLRFGTLFFGALATGCAGEALALRYAERSKAARAVAVTGKALFALFLASLIGIQAIIFSGCAPDEAVKDADYLLVLGAHVYPSGPSATLANRLDAAYDILTENPGMTAILCGGQGPDEPTTEAAAMRDYLISRGIGENRLLLEDASSNTIQNIRNAKTEFIGDGDRTAVVTSDFHLARAKHLMAREGLDPVGAPAPTPYLSQRIILHLREYGSILGLMITGRWF